MARTMWRWVTCAIFMGEDRRELAFRPCRQDHSGVEPDEPARRGERIQRIVLDHEEGECEIATVGGRGQPVSDGLNVSLDQRILDQRQPRSNLAHERFAERTLVGG